MVLIIEDDDTTRDLTARILRLAGHDVLTAADGEQALAILEREHPTVIFADLHMPNMDGWTFRRIQRGSPRLADIPFVVMSATVNVEEEGRALAANMTLAKPVDLDDILRHAKAFDAPALESVRTWKS